MVTGFTINRKILSRAIASIYSTSDHKLGALDLGELNSPRVAPEVHTTFSLFPTPYSLLPTPYSLLPTPYSLLPTPYSLLPVPFPQGPMTNDN
ncbi:MAG: hypothetical protein F6J98_37070 [Moorea sp. SIO4G2]|uniref:hypothetical protein n=1 Tax=unclassified Moorena TaxID=2683338 RepID=UPI0013F74ECE|nr:MULTISPECIES: hypothetical protein [unclassified Moorena]NEO12398.1 hypothetical protein [Moorena sp. SIO3E8]NEO65711.1 hypothetical protein [Moorena sp. SIO4G2]NEP97555.1 hypothetical protein [Moorena sp. SIO3F7]